MHWGMWWKGQEEERSVRHRVDKRVVTDLRLGSARPIGGEVHECGEYNKSGDGRKNVR